MRERPERVLLFRSGRHLEVALEAIEAAWPGAAVTVVATPPAIAALDQAGVPADRRIIYARTPFFRPLAFLRSACYWQALRTRPDHVAVLWNGPSGTGQSNVDHTALLLSPLGFSAIAPNGAILHRRRLPLLTQELARAAASLAVSAVIGLFLYAPARAVRLFRPE